MITITWSWLSFFAGVFATLSVGFWTLVFIAYKQYVKNKKRESSFESLFKG